ncbi:MFS transporter [Kitasatospora sp. NPDC059462]|uniref:MFS transporter n=2 Tax=unclassified Kitasatospora TaxID=2633591 RepID=UPI00367DC901
MTTLRSSRPAPGAARIAVLAAGHAAVDLYQGVVPALVPFLVAGRGLDYGSAAGVVLAATLLSSIVQPLFGALTDRWAMPWLIPAATAAAGIGVGLAGVAGPYPLLCAAVALSGVGVAAYHPESARLARAASGDSHTRMGWFTLGGNIGFALAPLMVGPVLAAGGLGATPWLALPALAAALLTAPVVRTLAARAATGPAADAADGARRDDRTAFLWLSAVIGCRSVVFVGLSSFVALYARQRLGGGSGVGTAALFTLFAGGAVGTVLGGWCAARWGRVRTVRLSYAAAVPAVAGLLLVPGPAALYGFSALISLALYVPFSLQVTLGQDYLPSRIGTASGVTLGLAVSVGGLAGPAIGLLADHAGLRTALAPLAVLCALAWLLARRLPEPGADGAAPTPVAAAGPGEADVRCAGAPSDALGEPARRGPSHGR